MCTVCVISPGCDGAVCGWSVPVFRSFSWRTAFSSGSVCSVPQGVPSTHRLGGCTHSYKEGDTHRQTHSYNEVRSTHKQTHSYNEVRSTHKQTHSYNEVRSTHEHSFCFSSLNSISLVDVSVQLLHSTPCHSCLWQIKEVTTHWVQTVKTTSILRWLIVISLKLHGNNVDSTSM